MLKREVRRAWGSDLLVPHRLGLQGLEPHRSILVCAEIVNGDVFRFTVELIFVAPSGDPARFPFGPTEGLRIYWESTGEEALGLPDPSVTTALSALEDGRLRRGLDRYGAHVLVPVLSEMQDPPSAVKAVLHWEEKGVNVGWEGVIERRFGPGARDWDPALHLRPVDLDWKPPDDGFRMVRVWPGDPGFAPDDDDD